MIDAANAWWWNVTAENGDPPPGEPLLAEMPNGDVVVAVFLPHPPELSFPHWWSIATALVPLWTPGGGWCRPDVLEQLEDVPVAWARFAQPRQAA